MAVPRSTQKVFQQGLQDVGGVCDMAEAAVDQAHVDHAAEEGFNFIQ
jgi:hypothetical protein